MTAEMTAMAMTTTQLTTKAHACNNLRANPAPTSTGGELHHILHQTGPYWSEQSHHKPLLTGLPFRTTLHDGTIIGLLPHLPNEHFVARLLPKQGNSDSELANIASEVLWRLFAVWGFGYVVTKYDQQKTLSRQQYHLDIPQVGLVEYCFSGQKMFFRCRDGGASHEGILDTLQPQPKHKGKGELGVCNQHP